MGVFQRVSRVRSEGRRKVVSFLFRVLGGHVHCVGRTPLDDYVRGGIGDGDDEKPLLCIVLVIGSNHHMSGNHAHSQLSGWRCGILKKKGFLSLIAVSCPPNHVGFSAVVRTHFGTVISSKVNVFLSSRKSLRIVKCLLLIFIQSQVELRSQGNALYPSYCVT